VDDDDGVLSPIECALILRGVPLFEGLTTRQLVNVAELVEQEIHPSGAMISREGEYSDCMYIIVEGTVAISTGETVLTQLGPKDFFGEVAIFEGARRTADVVAEDQEVELLRIGRDDLLRAMEELPAIAICICQTLARRVRALTERVNP
jgi:CRP-like cAMP-binding protein